MLDCLVKMYFPLDKQRDGEVLPLLHMDEAVSGLAVFRVKGLGV